MNPAPVLDQEFLPLRAKILEIGAALDRLGRNDALGRDPRSMQLKAAIETLLASDVNRAERIQLVFSRPYDDGWREAFKLPAPR